MSDGGDGALVVVVPVTAEPADIAASLERYRDGLAPLGRPLRFVVVLDGPQPRALESLRALRRRGGPPVEVLALPQRLGEAAALAVGLGHAGADTVLTLPAEPQGDPAGLPRLVAALDGCDMVVAARGSGGVGVHEGKLDWLLRRLLKSPFTDVRSAVRVMRGEVAAELNPYGNQHHFLPLIAQSQGFTVREIAAGPAAPGGPRRRLGPDWSVLLDVLTIWFLLRFIRKPFRFFGGFGFAVLALGVLATLWLVAARLIWGVALADRPALILSTLLIVLGLQIISVGLVGELITFTWGKDLKDYKVERLVE